MDGCVSVRGLVAVTSPCGFASVSESNCRQQAERCLNLWKRAIEVTGRRWKWGHSPCVSKTSPLAAAPPPPLSSPPQPCVGVQRSPLTLMEVLAAYGFPRGMPGVPRGAWVGSGAVPD